MASAASRSGNSPGGTILQESPTFGSGTHSNTSVVIDGDVIYGVCTNGLLQAWNRATDTVDWEISVGPGGSYSVTSNSMEVHDGYLYVQSADFAIHKILMSSGVEDPGSPLALDNTGVDALKAHMLVDYDNDRLYALGDSNYYAIDLTTFTQIWIDADRDQWRPGYQGRTGPGQRRSLWAIPDHHHDLPAGYHLRDRL